MKYYTCCDEPYLDITFNVTMRRKTLFYTVNLVRGKFKNRIQICSSHLCVFLPDHPLHGHLLPHRPRLLPALGLWREGDSYKTDIIKLFPGQLDGLMASFFCRVHPRVNNVREATKTANQSMGTKKRGKERCDGLF